jgi:ring-1,2-phenylacetyl-CoA epoxidase subunit PaaA
VLIRWGIKTKTNDELRQMFINQLVPELQALGLTIPDPDLRYDETSGNWVIGKIDWDEFWRVVKGDGPCNKERLVARRAAHEDGQWVREALAAYAEKEAQAV